ncbi:hypothetical protein SAMN02745129_1239 [Ferrimonas marina]|uniref:Lipid A deacylase LpxR family protein n=1 Tax=Ferrimonas marina TaxID=299255 RepID=A0A1M5P054_9GAMM|nr:hypothetical protein SAMN02745129_1239 [Ferrimonas marina]
MCPGLGLALLLAAHPAWSAHWRFAMDNDIVVASDGDYTNGFFLDRVAPSDNFSQLGPAPLLPFAQALNPEINYWHAQLAQQIWTPSSLEADEQSPIDRPYAGTLTTTLSLGHLTEQIDTRYRLTLGIVGPSSGAEWVQTQSHKWFGSTAPQGWDEQIEDTAVMQLGWEQNRRWGEGGEAYRWYGYQHARVLAGNLMSEAAWGSSLYWGQHRGGTLAGRHWNQAGLAEQKGWGWALFAGVELRYRLNDITLQGPRPDSAPDVNLEHWQGSYLLGLEGHYRQMALSFALVNDSRSYQESAESWNRYGRLAFSWRY